MQSHYPQLFNLKCGKVEDCDLAHSNNKQPNFLRLSHLQFCRAQKNKNSNKKKNRSFELKANSKKKALKKYVLHILC